MLTKEKGMRLLKYMTKCSGQNVMTGIPLVRQTMFLHTAPQLLSQAIIYHYGDHVFRWMRGLRDRSDGKG